MTTVYNRLSPQVRDTLIRDFAQADIRLPELAAAASLSHEEIIDFFEDPRTIDTLDRLERIAQRRTRFVQANQQPLAIEVLRLILAEFLNTCYNDFDPRTPEARAARYRLYETTRRAAGAILRGAIPPKQTLDRLEKSARPRRPRPAATNSEATVPVEHADPRPPSPAGADSSAQAQSPLDHHSEVNTSAQADADHPESGLLGQSVYQAPPSASPRWPPAHEVPPRTAPAHEGCPPDAALLRPRSARVPSIGAASGP